MSFFEELKRRNVIRIAAAYIVAAWLIIQVAETIFPLFGFGDGPARIAVILLAVAFVPAVIFAWVFELTPEGLKRERDIDRSKSITAQTGKRLDRIVTVALAVAVAFFAFDKFVLDPQRKLEIAESAIEAGVEQAREEALLSRFTDKSVAVLPFVNRSERKEDEYFTDGMHDELLTRLSRIASLKVISRTSMAQYRGTQKSIPEIASELSVRTILEGGVQRAGDQVRINVQLIDAQTDEHLWADIFDRKLTTENLFAIQSEISAAIAEALNAALTPAERTQMFDLPTTSMDAYNHFLRGRQLMASRRNEDLQNARAEFSRATEIDPGFALAWVGMADTIYLLEGQGSIAHPEAQPLRKQAVERALAINDQLGEAYATLAELYQDDGESEKAEAAYLKAIELNPNYVQAYHWYAISGLVSQEESLQLLYKAAQIDPLSLIVQRNIASNLGSMGRIDEARQVTLDLLERDPTFASGYRYLGNIAADSGELAEAIAWYRKAQPLDPGNGAALRELAYAHLALGDYDAVARIQSEMETHLGPESYPSGELKFWTWVAQANWQEAIDWLESGTDEAREPPPDVRLALDFLYHHAEAFEKAVDSLLKGEPDIVNRDLWQEKFVNNGWARCETAGILAEGGEEELGRDLLQMSIGILENQGLQRKPAEIDYVAAAVCYILDGSIDKSLDMFEVAVNKDVYVQRWFAWGKRPWWKRYGDNPRYLALVEQIESRIARQRQLLAEMDEDSPDAEASSR